MNAIDVSVFNLVIESIVLIYRLYNKHVNYMNIFVNAKTADQRCQ